jgi:hypothetical protein
LSEKVSILQILEPKTDSDLIYRDILLWCGRRLIEIVDKSHIYAVHKEDLSRWNIIDSSNRWQCVEGDISTWLEFAEKAWSVLEDSSFKLTELGNWLIEHHRPFRQFYEGDRTTKSYRLHSKRTYIKDKLEDLFPQVFKSGVVKSDRNNNLDTNVYSLSLGGIIIGLILCIEDKDENVRLITSNLLQIGWMLHLSRSDRSIFSLLLNILLKLGPSYDQSKLFKRISTLLVLALRDYDSLTKILLMSKSYDKVFHDAFINNLNNEAIEERKMMIFGFKHYIESKLCSSYRSVSREWENLRYEKLSDHSVLVLMAKCDKCAKNYPILLDFYKFLELPISGSADCSLDKIDCLECKARVSASLVNVFNH